MVLIFLIIALCSIILAYCFTVNLSLFEAFEDKAEPDTNSMLDIDSITYGSVLPPWQKIAERPITSFQLPLPLDDIEPPTKNSSKSTLAELNYISKLTTEQVSEEKRQVSREFLPLDGVLKYYIKFAGENGLMYSDVHLTNANNDVETLCTKLQLMYNRPRPAQLGFIKQITVDTVGQDATPSYPCCATMKAKVLSALLAYNNPKFKDKLDAIAKKIELSRLYGGLNFPSDNVVALKIADVILKRIKYLEK